MRNGDNFRRNMKISLIFICSALICCVIATRHQSTVIQENLEVEYFDKKFVDVGGVGLAKFNATATVVNITGMFKVDIPDDFKVTCRGFKKVNNEYRLRLFHYDTTIKEGLQMESFDLQSLFLEHTRPPVVWSMKKNVVYHSFGWAPSYNTWMPNFPEGRWKFQLTYLFANNTKVMVVNWFGKIQD